MSSVAVIVVIVVIAIVVIVAIVVTVVIVVMKYQLSEDYVVYSSVYIGYGHHRVLDICC